MSQRAERSRRVGLYFRSRASVLNHHLGNRYSCCPKRGNPRGTRILHPTQGNSAHVGGTRVWDYFGWQKRYRERDYLIDRYRCHMWQLGDDLGRRATCRFWCHTGLISWRTNLSYTLFGTCAVCVCIQSGVEEMKTWDYALSQ